MPKVLTVLKRIWLTAAFIGLAVTALAEEQSASLGDVRLRFESVGNGTALVLIHGWGHDMRTWEEIAPPLSQRYRVIRFDRRGWGRSSGSPDPLADPKDLDELLAYLGIEAAHVLGHSQGALVALALAQNFPKRVKALILYGSPAPAGFGLPWDGADSVGNLAALAREKGPKAVLSSLEHHPLLWFPADRAREMTQRYHSMLDENVARAFVTDEPAKARIPAAQIDRLREMTLPTLVLIGDHEIPYLKVSAEAIAYGISDSIRVVIPDAGHSAHLAQPERFIAEVLRYLATVDRAHAASQ